MLAGRRPRFSSLSARSRPRSRRRSWTGGGASRRDSTSRATSWRRSAGQEAARAHVPRARRRHRAADLFQLAQGASHWATLLRESGVRAGDRILVVAGATPDWAEVMLGALKIGAVTVPSTERLTASALDIRLAASGAKVAVASSRAELELARCTQAPTVLSVDTARVEARRLPKDAPTHDTGGRDAAFIVSTSGRTNGPRGSCTPTRRRSPRASTQSTGSTQGSATSSGAPAPRTRRRLCGARSSGRGREERPSCCMTGRSTRRSGSICSSASASRFSASRRRNIGRSRRPVVSVATAGRGRAASCPRATSSRTMSSRRSRTSGV